MEKHKEDSEQKDLKIKNLMKANLDLQNNLSSLSNIDELKEDLETQLGVSRDQAHQLEQDKISLRKELDNAGDFIIEQEERTEKANQTALELLHQLKEADSEIEQLKARIKQL